MFKSFYNKKDYNNNFLILPPSYSDDFVTKMKMKNLIRRKIEEGSEGEVAYENHLKTGEYTYNSSECHYHLPRKSLFNAIKDGNY